MSISVLARRLAATSLTVLAAACPVVALADEDSVPDAYTYSSASCTSGDRTDPLTLVFWGAGLNSSTATRPPSEIVADIEDDAFPKNKPISGGMQWALDGASCYERTASLGREFGPSKTVRGTHWDHREKKHIRLFNTTESGQHTVSGSPHRERKIDCGADKTPGDAVYKRYNGTDGFDAAAQEQASALRRENYDVVRHPTISPAQTTFLQCNGTPVTWSGNVYRVHVP